MHFQPFLREGVGGGVVDVHECIFQSAKFSGQLNLYNSMRYNFYAKICIRIMLPFRITQTMMAPT